MYKFIPFTEYESKYKKSHPNARISPDGKEVVLSLANGDVDRDAASKHIAKNWGENNGEG